MREYIIFDLETTGLDVNNDKIVEFACCIVNNRGRKIEEELILLINPEIPIPERVIKIHGISNEMIRNKPTFRNVSQLIKSKFENRIAVAYHGFKFDFPFLKNEFKRCGIEFEYFGCIDPKVRVKSLDYKVESHSLVNISKYFNIPIKRAHRALGDVTLLKRVFKKMYVDKRTYIKNNTYDLFDTIPDIIMGKNLFSNLEIKNS